MGFFRRKGGMGCQEARLVMSLHMNDDPSLTHEERGAFEVHLLACLGCRREYEEDDRLVALLKKHWGPISEGTRRLLETHG